MKELGEYLRETRNLNGVTLEEAALDLNVSEDELENIEEGNIRAFKDVYKLREDVKIYAKYLCLDPEKIADDFNEFLFEHTSKISLDDIKQAYLEEEDKSKKIKSPYTMEYKEKFNYRPVLIAGILVVLISVLVFIILNSINKTPIRDRELKKVDRVEVGYEYA